MFLSLHTSAWILIAAGATLFNLAAMQWVIQIPEYRKKQFWIPVLGIIAVIGRSLLQGHALAETLFVYATASPRSSESSSRTRRSMSATMGRTASTLFPAGSVSSQSR